MKLVCHSQVTLIPFISRFEAFFLKKVATNASFRESKSLTLNMYPLMFHTLRPSQTHLGSVFKNNTRSMMSISSSTSSFISVVDEYITNCNKIKSIQKYNHLRKEEDEEEEIKVKNPFQGTAEAIFRVVHSLQKPASAVVLLGSLVKFNPLVTYHHPHWLAFAASGGRIGGSLPSSSSSNNYYHYYNHYYTRNSGAYSKQPNDNDFLMAYLLILFALTCLPIVLSETPRKRTVLKLQVGLLGTAKSLQKDLDRIAEVADTSTKKGLNYVLKDTISALLRCPDYWISGYSFVDVKKGYEYREEEHFKRLCTEERAKIDEETLVNVNNIKRKRTTISSRTDTGLSNEYIVITILVAAKGPLSLPAISSSADLKDALQKLASISAADTEAVEVLWTPQLENDTLTELEVLEDYPLLKPIHG